MTDPLPTADPTTFLYAVAAALFTVAAVLWIAAAYKRLKDRRAPVDNVYPLRKRTL